MHERCCGILLAGGRGTRISHLCPDTPKPMIPAAGQPFIEWVLRHLAAQGVGRFVISLGHLAEVAERHFAERPADGLSIVTYRESEPLGTGGALCRAARQAPPECDWLLAANGDSLVLASLGEAFAQLERDDVDGVLVGLEMEDTARYGRLQVDRAGRLWGFCEKQPGRGLINAGIYLFKREILDRFPPRMPLAMETEVFPALLAAGVRLQVVASDAPFLDIGTPESLRQAGPFIEQHFNLEVSS